MSTASYSKSSWSRRVRICCVAGAMTVASAGCGTAQEESSPDVQRVQDAERKAPDAQATAAAASDQVPEDTADGSGCITVPDVVGKDHQLAQDTMQAAGLYMLQEQDASGQGRMLLVDRNWTTVRQRPSAGECVSEDTEIMLSAVKDEER
jgi:hypothetical protein